MSSVSDGDTISALTPDGQIDVRLIWINAPENGECLAPEARGHLEESLTAGPLRLETHGFDQYGRTLAVVWAGERNVNRGLVEAGMAIATADSGDFLTLERSAAAAGLGLWAKDACQDGPMPAVTIDRARSTFDAPGADGGNLASETVTIRNAGDIDVDLRGWVIRDESSRHRFRFPDGALLRRGETLTITSADAGWDPGGSPVWNNDGDIVMILDSHGRVVDHWRYGPAP